MTVSGSVPSPLGWCTLCLADDQAERQAVTMHRGNGLCRTCNAAASTEGGAMGALQEGLRDVRAKVEEALATARRR